MLIDTYDTLCSLRPDCDRCEEQGTPSYTRKQSEGAMEHFRYEVSFENITTQVGTLFYCWNLKAILQEDEYTVTISTELNGRTVTQTVEKFPMGQTNPT